MQTTTVIRASEPVTRPQLVCATVSMDGRRTSNATSASDEVHGWSVGIPATAIGNRVETPTQLFHPVPRSMRTAPRDRRAERHCSADGGATSKR